MILVFLGNFEKKYENTRHNAGRMFGRFLKDKMGVDNKQELKFGYIIEFTNRVKGLFLNCLMNESGKCLTKALNKVYPDWKNKKDFQDLWVAHDDLDILFGQFKLQFGRGPAGHHGVESIIEVLGTDQFWRIRIVINRPPINIPSENYVLMHFAKEEMQRFTEVFQKIF